MWISDSPPLIFPPLIRFQPALNLKVPRAARGIETLLLIGLFMQLASFPLASSVLRCVLAAVVVGVVSGCQPSAPAAAKPNPPEVIVARPTKQLVGEFEDFTGRLEPYRQVQIRSRVSGYLDKINFKDGAEVTEGDLLFQIDPRTYGAEVERTEAALAQAKARRIRTELDQKRAIDLAQKKAISTQDADRATGDLAEAVAGVASAEAMLDAAKIQLDYTKITSPLTGRISRRLIDEGNLVTADVTPLVTIVALDPIYATFEVDERTVLQLRRLLQQGALTHTDDEPASVQIGLSDEDGFSLSAPVSFVDNQVDRETGTLQLRATLKNKGRSLAPGLFVRVRVPLGEPKPSILVPEEALGSDQGQRYVFVVDDNSDAVYKRVKVGQQVGRMRVIQEGLEGDEQVIVSGLQRVRRGAKVTPKVEGATASAKGETPSADKGKEPGHSPSKDASPKAASSKDTPSKAAAPKDMSSKSAG
jgi:multidrug efflux system membrane fusion protein